MKLTGRKRLLRAAMAVLLTVVVSGSAVDFAAADGADHYGFYEGYAGFNFWDENAGNGLAAITDAPWWSSNQSPMRVVRAHWGLGWAPSVCDYTAYYSITSFNWNYFEYSPNHPYCSWSGWFDFPGIVANYQFGSPMSVWWFDNYTNGWKRINPDDVHVDNYDTYAWF